MAVFDGHAGAWVAQALTTNLYKKLNEANVFKDEPIDYDSVVRKVWTKRAACGAVCADVCPSRALSQVYMDLDATICQKLREQQMNDGSTCVTVTLKGNEMLMSHTGDSRAVAKIGKVMCASHKQSEAHIPCRKTWS